MVSRADFAMLCLRRLRGARKHVSPYSITVEGERKDWLNRPDRLHIMLNTGRITLNH